VSTTAVTTVHRPGPDVAAGLATLVEALGSDAGPPVGERKRVQLYRLDDTPWSALIATGDDDHPVAYAHVRWEEPERAAGLVATVELAVREDDDPLAARLLAAASEAIGDAGGGRWQLWAHRDVVARAAERAGMETTRRLLLMHRLLAERDAAAEPAMPEGITLARLREERDDDALIAVNNEAFAGHPEQGGWTRADLAARRAVSWYDPDDVLLAWRGDELLGFHWTKRHPPGQQEINVPGRLGEVYVLAVAPRAQGLGLGRTLLRAGLAHLARRECTDAALFVDGDEPAVALYTAEGFATVRAHRCYAGRATRAAKR
jgi:mycothiol synthase